MRKFSLPAHELAKQFRRRCYQKTCWKYLMKFEVFFCMPMTKSGYVLDPFQGKSSSNHLAWIKTNMCTSRALLLISRHLARAFKIVFKLTGKCVKNLLIYFYCSVHQKKRRKVIFFADPASSLMLRNYFFQSNDFQQWNRIILFCVIDG